MSSVGHVGIAAQRGAYRQHRALIVAGAGGLVLCGLAFAVVLTSDQPGNRPLIALGRVLIIAVPIAVGIWLWSQPQYERFGRLLVVAGYVSFLAALAESSNSGLYSIGRIGVWVGRDGDDLPDPLVPERTAEDDSRARAGRGDGGVHRGALRAGATDRREHPPAAAGSLVRGGLPGQRLLRALVRTGLLGGLDSPCAEASGDVGLRRDCVAARLRIRAASYLMRKTLAPVLVVAIVRCLAFLLLVVVMRDLGLFLGARPVVGWMFFLGLPAIAIAFLVGVLRRRLYAGAALQRLAGRLRDDPNADLPVAIGEAIADPSLEVAYWAPGLRGPWVDENGRSVDAPRRGLGALGDGDPRPRRSSGPPHPRSRPGRPGRLCWSGGVHRCGGPRESPSHCAGGRFARGATRFACSNPGGGGCRTAAHRARSPRRGAATSRRAQGEAGTGRRAHG